MVEQSLYFLANVMQANDFFWLWIMAVSSSEEDGGLPDPPRPADVALVVPPASAAQFILRKKDGLRSQLRLLLYCDHISTI